MWVLLQTVDAIAGGHGSGISHESRTYVVILFGQQHLLAPVTDDITHKCRTRTGGSMCGPVAFLRELCQTVTQHLRHHEVGAPSATARRVEPFALQVSVPPAALVHRAATSLSCLFSFAVIDILVGIAQYLITLVRGIHIETGAAAYIIDRWQIPLLDMLCGACVIEQLTQQGALLDGIDLQSWTVGVNIAQHIAVSVAYARTGKPSRMWIHRVAALYHLVGTVAIDVGYTQLMELGRPGRLVVTAPGVRVVPVCRCAVSPVVVPCKDVVMMSLVVVAIQAFHHQRGMDAVEIADGEVPVHGRVAITHIVWS